MTNQLKKVLFLLTGLVFGLILFAFQGHADPVPTPGGLLQYSDQNDFERSFPNLPKEDFEESPIADNTYIFFPEPLDSTSNIAGGFAPGDILDGLSIGTVAQPGGDSLGIVGANSVLYGNMTVMVAPVSPTSNPAVSFTAGEVYAAGMDLMLNAADNVTITIYGPGSSILDTLTVALPATETFFGVYSLQPITRITVVNNLKNIFVDNIQFGGSASTVTFYTDQSAFETAYPGLPLEDFEESPVPDGLLMAFPEPLDKTTNAPGAFAPGDILDDIHIQSITNSNPDTALQVVGDDYGVPSMENQSKVVCDGPTGNDLRVIFANLTATEYEMDTYAIGMDLWQWAPSIAPTIDGIVAVYDIGGKLLGAETVAVAAGQGNFIGISSNQVLVVITFQLIGPPPECIDNIQYGGSVAGLTFYRNRDDFNKARSNLPMEDFSESPVPDATPQICSEPIDSSTSEAGCFAPGDILPNISFQTEGSLNPGCPACMTLYGANTPPLGNTTPMLVAAPPDLLEISFTGKRVHFAGFNSYLISRFSIYGTDDTLLGTSVKYSLVPGLGFWGVESTRPISRITVWGSPALVNEISFGSKFPWPMYGPATGGAEPNP